MFNVFKNYLKDILSLLISFAFISICVKKTCVSIYFIFGWNVRSNDGDLGDVVVSVTY